MEYTETGVVVLALTVVMVAMKIVERFVDKRERDKEGQLIVKCPNRIESLAETLHNLEKIASRATDVAGAARTGVERLVDQHAPEDGVEQWKLQPRFERMWEEQLLWRMQHHGRYMSMKKTVLRRRRP